MSPSTSHTKYKNRKLRYTFPSENDDFSDNSVTFKSQNSIPNNNNDDLECYNEKRTIITKTSEGTKKKVIITKYTKIHPEHHPEIHSKTHPENNTETKKVFSTFLSRIAYFIRSVADLTTKRSREWNYKYRL
jgi:hypothetical protein